MNSDALFQLGICPAGPDAAQREDLALSRPMRARETGLLARAAAAIFVVCKPASRFPSRYRGNVPDSPL